VRASDIDRFLAGRSLMKERKAAGAGDIDKILARLDARALMHAFCARSLKCRMKPAQTRFRADLKF
jgi:hypothetical protein